MNVRMCAAIFGGFFLFFILVLDAGLASAQQSKDQQKCINKMNKAGDKLAGTSTALTSNCLKQAGKGKVGDAAACVVADEKGKVLKARGQVQDASDKHCAIEFPTIAAHADAATGVTIVQGAGRSIPSALFRDLVGSALDTQLACDEQKQACKCQGHVVKTAAGLMKGMGKTWLKCKKLMLATKDPVPTGATTDEEIAACISGSADPDTGGLSVNENSLTSDSKIGKLVGKLAGKLESSCAGLPVDPFVGDDPGEGACEDYAGPGGSEDWGALAGCVESRARCHWCDMVQTMDDIDGLIDCDLFDDGVNNGSCDLAECGQPIDPDGGTYDDCDPTPSGGTCDLVCDAGGEVSGDGTNDCVDGVWVDDQTCEQVRYAFVSTTGYVASTGVSGADDICQTEADNSTYDGSKLQGRTWVAWLSTESLDARDRIDDAEYRRPDEVVVANSKADLTDGSIDAAIEVTATGASVPSGGVATGTTAAGEHSGLSCSNWMVNGGTRTIGSIGAVNSSWTNFLEGSCATSANFVYCFEDY